MFFLAGGMSILLGIQSELIMRTYYESQAKTTYLLARGPPGSRPRSRSFQLSPLNTDGIWLPFRSRHASPTCDMTSSPTIRGATVGIGGDLETPPSPGWVSL